MGIGSVTAVCSKELLGIEDTPKDMISGVVGAGIYRERARERRKVHLLQLCSIGQSTLAKGERQLAAPTGITQLGLQLRVVCKENKVLSTLQLSI